MSHDFATVTLAGGVIQDRLKDSGMMHAIAVGWAFSG
jgi:hypothetical protein